MCGANVYIDPQYFRSQVASQKLVTLNTAQAGILSLHGPPSDSRVAPMPGPGNGYDDSWDADALPRVMSSTFRLAIPQFPRPRGSSCLGHGRRSLVDRFWTLCIQCLHLRRVRSLKHVHSSAMDTHKEECLQGSVVLLCVC